MAKPYVKTSGHDIVMKDRVAVLPPMSWNCGRNIDMSTHDIRRDIAMSTHHTFHKAERSVFRVTTK
jgi:hypothetical protein